MLDVVIDIIEERRKMVDNDILHTLQHKDIDTKHYDELAYMMDRIDDIYFDIKCYLENIKEGNDAI